MLQMGDEAHNRNRAGTLMLLRDLSPADGRPPGSTPADVAEALRFVGGNDHFFLNLAMPACKLALDAARGIEGSTMVVAMARNGTDFGIQVAGTGDEWFTGPAQLADGLFLGDYGPDDANPDIGDSAITETAGIGGFAMATAPAIVRFVGGSVPDALATTRRMHEITLGENPRWSVPVLEFQGTPTGIDVTKVCRTGILPQINTGMAGKVAGVGQVGAGLVTPPAEIFPKALARLAELARPDGGARRHGRGDRRHEPCLPGQREFRPAVDDDRHAPHHRRGRHHENGAGHPGAQELAVQGAHRGSVGQHDGCHVARHERRRSEQQGRGERRARATSEAPPGQDCQLRPGTQCRLGQQCVAAGQCGDEKPHPRRRQRRGQPRREHGEHRTGSDRHLEPHSPRDHPPGHRPSPAAGLHRGPIA